MSKYDKLISKIEVFEKLATSGDFLKSIGKILDMETNFEPVSIKPVIPFRADVMRAQQRLMQSPYNYENFGPGGLDGKLGPITTNILRQYIKDFSPESTIETAIHDLSTKEYTVNLPPPQSKPVNTWGVDKDNEPFIRKNPF